MRTGLPVGRGSGRVLPLPRLGTARGQRSCPPPAPRRLENSSSFPQGLGQLRPPAGPAHTPPDRRRLPFDRGERDRLPAVPFGSVIVSGGTGNRFRAESVIFFSGIRTCWNRRAELVPAHPTSRSASRACPPCPPPACPPARACPLSVMFRRRFLRSVLDCEAGGRLRWRVTTRRAWGGCAGMPRRGPAVTLRFACPLSIMFRRRFLRSVLDCGRLLACWRGRAKTRARPRAPLRLPALHHVSQEIPAKRAGSHARSGAKWRQTQERG